jgi:hypothetical protein
MRRRIVIGLVTGLIGGVLSSAIIGCILGFVSDGRFGSGVLLSLFLIPPAASAGISSGVIISSLCDKNKLGINGGLFWAIVTGIGFGLGTSLEGEWTVAGAILFSVIGAVTGWLVVGRITKSSVLERKGLPRTKLLVLVTLGLVLITASAYTAVEFWNSIFEWLVD